MMRYLSMATGKLYIPGIFLALAGCMAGSKDVESVAEPVRIPEVYSRYLAYPVPSMGVEVAFNPPVLRWPVA